MPLIRIVMLAYHGMTQLDLTAPYEVFARIPSAELEVVASNGRRAVRDASGLHIMPTNSYGGIGGCEVLFVPGGPGQLDLMEDVETIDFLERVGTQARFVTSVCTGSLLLGAAGLLKGYRATCHWLSLPQLALLGAIPVEERVVVDRNRITGAGVTSGLDFALKVAAELVGEEEARRIALAIEYEPEPPFPARAQEAPELVAQVRAGTAAFQARREEVARKVGARLARRPPPGA